MGQERKLVKQFDKNGDGRLEQERTSIGPRFPQKERTKGSGRGRFGFGPPPGLGGEEAGHRQARPPR